MANRKKVTSVVVNDDESNRLNSTALRRIDTGFLKLHGTASQVAVYRYNPTTQSWDKTDTVGCLFIYERNISPKYGLVVMNRKNASNFMQCFGPDAQVVLHEPYLLLRAVDDIYTDAADNSQVIHCVWFYDDKECVISAKILRNMGLQFESGGGAFGMPGGMVNSSRQLSGNALIQILQGTQGRQKEIPVPKGKLVNKVMTAEELESQMLYGTKSENRAKHGMPPVKVLKKPKQPVNKVVNGQLFNPNPGLTNSPKTKGGPVFNQFVNMYIADKVNEPRVSGDAVTSESTLSHLSLTQGLGSQNQMRTVEQLERKMRKDRQSESSATASIQSELMQTLGIVNSTPVKNKTDFNHAQSVGSSTSMSQASNKSGATLDDIIGKSVDETDPDDLRQVLEHIEPSNLILVTETVPGADEARLTWRINRSSSLHKDNDSTFTTPTGEFVSAAGTRCSSQLGADSRYSEGGSRQHDISRPTPLTKEQLVQALSFLIQNDADFVTKIHDSYLKSLHQAFDGRRF